MKNTQFSANKSERVQDRAKVTINA